MYSAIKDLPVWTRLSKAAIHTTVAIMNARLQLNHLNQRYPVTSAMQVANVTPFAESDYKFQLISIPSSGEIRHSCPKVVAVMFPCIMVMGHPRAIDMNGSLIRGNRPTTEPRLTDVACCLAFRLCWVGLWSSHIPSAASLCLWLSTTCAHVTRRTQIYIAVVPSDARRE